MLPKFVQSIIPLHISIVFLYIQVNKHLYSHVRESMAAPWTTLTVTLTTNLQTVVSLVIRMRVHQGNYVGCGFKSLFGHICVQSAFSTCIYKHSGSDSGGLNANYVASITSHFSLSRLQGVSLFSLSFERCTYSVTESLEELRTRMDII